MKKTMLWLFYGLLGVFLVAVAGGFALPGEANVTRTALIAAPPAQVFAVVSDLNRNRDWSPWFDIDPNMTANVSGPAGVGQKLTWVSSNPNVGSGTQVVTEFVADQRVTAALDFGDMGQAMATVDLAPEGDGTKVTWRFSSKLNNVIERWFGLLFDRWIGADFEKGLASLKTYVEKGP